MKYKIGDRFMHKRYPERIIVIHTVFDNIYHAALYEAGDLTLKDWVVTTSSLNEYYTKLPEGNLTTALYL